MAKPEWGFKRTCLSCAAKFYDMQKDPIICPSCGTVFDPESATKLRRGRPSPAEAKAREAKPAAAAKGSDDESDDFDDDLEDDIDDDMDDDGVLEDTSDLDDDDVPVVGGGSKNDDDDN